MILITGAAGQLGTDLCELADGLGLKSLGVDRSTLDITSPGDVAAILAGKRYDAVINAAAYTAVDRAEEESDLAFRVNRDGVRNLAEACVSHSIPLFQVSTDYVFDGKSERPYREDDPVAPLGVYGQSKWEGEEAVRASGVDHVILRVSWLFGHGGANFVRTMRRLSTERPELRVVADQHGCPTPTRALAGVLLDLASRTTAPQWGTYHYAGQPATTWHQFAEEIIEGCRRDGGVVTERVVPIPTSEYPTPAERPAYSVLDCTKIGSALAIEAPSWRSALTDVLDRWRT